MTAPEQHEHAIYRVDWVFMLGTMGDSEGRTWAKERVEEKRFATKAKAEAYRDNHPDLELSQWGSWKTKNYYGQFAIVRQEVPIDALALPEVKALVEALEAKTVMDPNNSNSTWLDAQARTALAALTTPPADGGKP